MPENTRILQNQTGQHTKASKMRSRTRLIIFPIWEPAQRIQRWHRGPWRKSCCQQIVTVVNGKLKDLAQNSERTPVARAKVPVVDLENGNNMSMTFAVMNVTAPLAAVSWMVKTGRTVVCFPNESFGETPKGVRHPLIENNGVCILKAPTPRKPAPGTSPRNSRKRAIGSSGDGVAPPEEEGGDEKTERLAQTAPIQPTQAMIDAHEVSHV